MIAADSLRIIVLSGVPIRWFCACRRACRASAPAPHLALPSHVQASCSERARPAVPIALVRAFAGVLAAHAAALPGRRCPERQRGAKAEGKIEGCGTKVRAKPVCTWGWRGTRQIAAPCRVKRQCLACIGEAACHARPALTVLEGGVP
ncbi:MULTISPECIES: hypothetical protein [Alcaligenaceae]|uniref:hypothetical protein n=1 Tax=Alcaligenaceae TaxID=506 RepID=UPI0012E83065|nr:MULTISPECIES: hypothetical protein [Alcaligenaceae]